jgi:hypothetical protein
LHLMFESKLCQAGHKRHIKSIIMPSCGTEIEPLRESSCHTKLA